ncbi:MAG: L-fucose:H+ symporter permease, partial [Bacteroidaceae bacterium]|nr:L-fucose:H+ symporter permease [Bacteroidaceae bacterium]
PMGSLMGMAVASMIVLPSLISDKRDAAGEIIFHSLSEAEKASIRLHDLAVIRDPYVALGLLVLAVFIVVAITKIPSTKEQGTYGKTSDTLARLWKNRVYREGVVAQVFYVAAQIMVWTFIIQYADNLGIDKSTAQNYNILAMIMFLSFRFISTFLMRYVNSRVLLAVFGICASIATLGTILIEGIVGLYCLVAISAFMSLMFPTIYGVALVNVEKRDTELGAAFLVMAIVGGALMPPLQGMIIDCGSLFGLPAVNVSYSLPLLCFIVITIFACRSLRKKSAV